MIEKSCGTIPYTINNGKIYYLLVKSKNNICGFPKGHVEANETEEETALRETWEETSLKVKIKMHFRHEMSYEMNNGNIKIVVYFLANFQNQTPKRNNNFENFKYLLLPLDLALQELTFENTRQMLKVANDFLTDVEHKASLV